MNTFYGNKNKIVDYVFWIALIIFTNPGGILQAFGEDRTDGGVNVTDLLIAIQVICFLVVFKRDYYKLDKTFIKISKYLLIFFIYYIVVFSFFIPQFKNSPDYLFFKTLIKVRHGFINILLFQFIYLFYLRSYKIFFKFFILSSVGVLSVFIFSVISGMDILPLKILDRRFVSINRLLLLSYGLMPLLMSMGAVLLIFKFKLSYKKMILIAFVLMSLTWILSLLRRQIFGSLLLFVLIAVLSNYIYKKNLVPLKKVLIVLIQVTVLVFIIKLSFPKYLDAVESAIGETINVFKFGETVSGKQDVRLGFGKVEMQAKIKDNYIWGTGFDNNWRVSEEAGYEASDYPLLSAIAMVGIIGMIVFVPVYLILYKTIFRDINYLRKSKVNIELFEHYILLVLIVYFLFEILNYTYWFLPVSLFSHAGHHKWYIFLAMFFASRRVFYVPQK